MTSSVELTVAVTLLLALIGACVMFGRNLNALDDLRSRAKGLDELPKLVARQDQHADFIAASTRQLAKLTDRINASERLATERHEQVLAELRLLRATKASRESMPAVTALLPPRPRARSVPDVTEDDDDDDGDTIVEGKKGGR